MKENIDINHLSELNKLILSVKELDGSDILYELLDNLKNAKYDKYSNISISLPDVIVIDYGVLEISLCHQNYNRDEDEDYIVMYIESELYNDNAAIVKGDTVGSEGTFTNIRTGIENYLILRSTLDNLNNIELDIT